jgi:hypothetical protein
VDNLRRAKSLSGKGAWERTMPEREQDERFHLNLEDNKEFAIFRVDPEGRIASSDLRTRSVAFSPLLSVPTG